MLHFDLLENPTLFLGFSKDWLKNLLIKNNIDFYEFPIDQRNRGWNAIQFFSKSVEIWFDCVDIGCRSSFEIPSRILYFNGKSLDAKEGASCFLITWSAIIVNMLLDLQRYITIQLILLLMEIFSLP